MVTELSTIRATDTLDDSDITSDYIQCYNARCQAAGNVSEGKIRAEVGKRHRNILHFSKTQNTQVKGPDATGMGSA
jgi:hypothetical protein